MVVCVVLVFLVLTAMGCAAAEGSASTNLEVALANPNC
jgi:hypothetical protein